MTNKLKRVMAMLLTFVMLIGMIPTTSVQAMTVNNTTTTLNENQEPADESDDELADKPEVKEPKALSTKNDDFSLSIEWSDLSAGNINGTSLDIDEDQSVTTAVKLRVNYTSMQVQPEGYEAGDLIITVKGIGDTYRNSVQAADVAADPQNSSIKTHDWSYTWNKTNDTYTFVNNEKITGNSVFSGYFEMVWNLQSRKCENGYSQDDISATMYLPDGSQLSTDSLSFAYHTHRDTFSLTLDDDSSNLYSYQGLTKYIPGNPDDYAYVKYLIKSGTSTHSRAAINQQITFNPDVSNIGSGAIVILPGLNITDNNDGTYSIPKNSTSVYVAYPKDQYTNQSVDISVKKTGIYLDEDGSRVTLAEDTATHTIPGDFHFTDISGNIYDFWIRKHGYSNQYGGDIYGPNMRNNLEDYYNLNLLLNNVKNTYTAEMVNDALYITTQDGYRQLGKDEYELTSITIPSASSVKNINGLSIDPGTVEVWIYATQNDNGTLHTEELDPVKKTFIGSSEQTISLTPGTTSVAVVIKETTDSFQNISFPVHVKFHTNGINDNLINGQVVPTGFIKLYDAKAEPTDNQWGKWINDNYTENNYEDFVNLGLADRDLHQYGHHLDREKTEITFYGYIPSYQYVNVNIDPLQLKENHFETTVRLTGQFYYPLTEAPNSYGLYTILPEGISINGLAVPEDAWNLIKTSIDCDSITVDTNYQNSGRTYIGLHFNQKPYSSVTATIPVRTDRNGTINVYGALINDELVTGDVGNDTDNGYWSDSSVLFSDLNQNGDTSETIATDKDTISPAVVPDSSQLGIKKYVKTNYSNGFTTDPASAGFHENYTYQLSFWTGNGKAQHIVIMDTLENGYDDEDGTHHNSEWQGFLDNSSASYESVDLSLAEAAGLHGTVWYSTKTDPDPNAAGDWSTDKTNAKAIKIDFGNTVLNPGEQIDILVHMSAPNQPELKNKLTFNQFSIDFEMMDATHPNYDPVHENLTSNHTSVYLIESLETIVVTKVDKEDETTKLKDAVFELYDKENPDQPIATATSNANGYAIFHNIPSNKTYILHEAKAPYGYLAAEDQEITVSPETLRITVKDPHKTGAIEINKSSTLTGLPLENAEFAVFNKDTDEQVGESVFTDSQGYAKIENLPWGNYYLKEINAPEGYITSDKVYEFSVTRESVENPPQIFRIDNEQEPTKLAVLKTDDQNQPLSGAILELVYQVNESSSFRYGLYVTDANGRVDIEDLPYGSYILKEYRAPKGYEKFEDFPFTLQPDSPALGEDGYRTIAITAKDTRQKGSVTIVKNDDIGNQIAGVEFTLYNQENKEVGKAVTNEAGIAKIDNLEWGSYILKETYAPKYYEINNEAHEIEITAANLNVQMTIVNTTRKGSVVMTKYDDTETKTLEGAVYSLYSVAGEYIGNFTTGSDGTLTVENLAWGSYYFKEKKAPAGYGLSDELIRFSINANNSTTVQELTATDKEITSSITVTKTIKADDINFANGNPTFIFCVKGQAKSYVAYKSVVFDEDYVKSHTDKDNMVSQTITISELPNDIYEVSELDTSRYALEKITNVVNGTVQDDKAIIDLTVKDFGSTSTQIPTGAVEFINKIYESQDFSHTDLKTNILSERQKLTSISVDYKDSIVAAGSNVDYNKLTVIANYDDGTSRPLNSNDYHLSQETFSTVNGEYTIDVTFTDNSITRHGNFTVNINDGIDYIISLKATYINKKPLYVSDKITPSMFTVEATTNTHDVRTLNTNEYLVLMPNTDTDAVAEAETNEVRIVLNIDNVGYGVSTIVTDIPAIRTKPTLQKGEDFKKNIKSDTTAILFNNAIWPDEDQLIDVSDARDQSVVAWYVGTTMYVRAKNNNAPVIANNDCSSMFANCTSLTSLDLSNLDTSSVTNMSYMFQGCSRLTSLDLSNFDTSSVTDMNHMFSGCWRLKSLDVTNWNTSSVKNMGSMFNGCSDLTSLDVTNFDTSSVTDMSFMFSGCYGLTSLNVSNFNTSSVTDMGYMFDDCDRLTSLDVTNFDTSSVTNMNRMFRGCSGLTSLDLSNFDTSGVTDMSWMFYDCYYLTSLDVSNWNTSSVTSMSYMFRNCSRLTSLDVTNFDTSSVTDMIYMFNGCRSLTSLDLSNFDTSSVTDMKHMFSGCSGLTSLDLSSFDTSDLKRRGADNMFMECSNISTAYARTRTDANTFNTSRNKPSNVHFVVKPAA